MKWRKVGQLSDFFSVVDQLGQVDAQRTLDLMMPTNVTWSTHRQHFSSSEVQMANNTARSVTAMNKHEKPDAGSSNGFCGTQLPNGENGAQHSSRDERS